MDLVRQIPSPIVQKYILENRKSVFFIEVKSEADAKFHIKHHAPGSPIRIVIYFRQCVTGRKIVLICVRSFLKIHHETLLHTAPYWACFRICDINEKYCFVIERLVLGITMSGYQNCTQKTIPAKI